MLLPDTILAQRYRILQAIKSGGAGQVYQAFDQRLQVQVAIKQLMAEHMAQAFVREAQLLAHLQHPALPRVSDYFSEAGADFVVMDFIPGPDLSDLIRQHGAPFAPADVVDWGVQLLDALEYLHTHTPPILHRDIKPHNLKLTANKRLMLLDFGLAKGSPLAEHMTTHSVAGYTTRLCAPGADSRRRHNRAKRSVCCGRDFVSSADPATSGECACSSERAGATAARPFYPCACA